MSCEAKDLPGKPDLGEWQGSDTIAEGAQLLCVYGALAELGGGSVYGAAKQLA